MGRKKRTGGAPRRPCSSRTIQSEVRLAEAAHRSALPGRDGFAAGQGKPVHESLRALRDLALVRPLGPRLRRLLLRIADVLERGVLRRSRVAVADRRPELYRMRGEVLAHDVAECCEEIRRLQALVGVRRNDIAVLLRRLGTIEDSVERVLVAEDERAREKLELDRLVRELRREVDSEAAEHGVLGEQIETRSKEIHAASQALYEACRRRQTLQHDLKNARQELETHREQASDASFVPARLVGEVWAEVRACRGEVERYDAEHRSGHGEHVELLRTIRRWEDQLDRHRQERAEVMRTVATRMRSHTPRPDWPGIAEASPTVGAEAGAAGEGTCPPASRPTASLVEWMAAFLERHHHGGVGGQAARARELGSELEAARRELAEMRAELAHAEAHVLADGKSAMRSSAELMLGEGSEVYLRALGVGAEVPPYLRFEGHVRLRLLCREEVRGAVRRAWAARAARAGGGKDFATSFRAFLETEHGPDPSAVAKYGYCYVHAFQHYGWDAEIDLFLQVLLGRVPEHTLADRERLDAALRRLFERIGAAAGRDADPDTPTSTILRDDLFASLGRFFPFKSGPKLEELRSAVVAEQPGPELDVVELLCDRTDAIQSFVAAVHRQHLDEVKLLWKGLMEQLRASSTAGTGKCLVVDVVKALRRNDPHIPHQKLLRYLAVGLGADPDDAQDGVFSTLSEGSSTRFLGIEAFIANLLASDFCATLRYDPEAEPVVTAIDATQPLGAVEIVQDTPPHGE